MWWSSYLKWTMDDFSSLLLVVREGQASVSRDAIVSFYGPRIRYAHHAETARRSLSDSETDDDDDDELPSLIWRPLVDSSDEDEKSVDTEIRSVQDESGTEISEARAIESVNRMYRTLETQDNGPNYLYTFSLGDVHTAVVIDLNERALKYEIDGVSRIRFRNKKAGDSVIILKYLCYLLHQAQGNQFDNLLSPEGLEETDCFLNCLPKTLVVCHNQSVPAFAKIKVDLVAGNVYETTCWNTRFELVCHGRNEAFALYLCYLVNNWNDNHHVVGYKAWCCWNGNTGRGF